MKKSAFLSIVCTLFVLTALTSCSMSPDMMLQQYNDKLYEDIGGGVYITNGKPNIMTGLIPNSVYPVYTYKPFKLEITKAYYDYKWTLKDNSSEQEYNLPGYFIVYAHPEFCKFQKGKEYTLTVLVHNKLGQTYTDTTTLKVVE